MTTNKKIELEDRLIRLITTYYNDDLIGAYRLDIPYDIVKTSLHYHNLSKLYVVPKHIIGIVYDDNSLYYNITKNNHQISFVFVDDYGVTNIQYIYYNQLDELEWLVTRLESYFNNK